MKAAIFIALILTSITGLCQDPVLMLPIGHNSLINSINFSPDRKFFITSSWDATAKIWNSEDARLVMTLQGHTQSVNTAQYSSDGKYIVTASDDSTVRVWNSIDGTMSLILRGHENGVTSAAFSPDCKTIITTSWDGNAILWNAGTGTFISSAPSGGIYAAYSPNGKYLVLSERGGATIFTSQGKRLKTLDGHKALVTMANFSPDSKYVVTCSWDGTIKIWSIETGRMLKQLSDGINSYESASYSSDGKFLITSYQGGIAEIWNVKTGKVVSTFEDALCADYSMDGKLIVSASESNTIQIRRATDQQIVKENRAHTAVINHAEFSPDGKYIITASSDSTARIWSVADGSIQSKFKAQKGVSCAKFSRDGKTVVTASYDDTVRIYNTSNGVKMVAMAGHIYGVQAASFSQSGKYVATASSDMSVRLWNATDGRQLLKIDRDSAFMNDVAFSPDDKFLLTASSDTIPKIWDVKTGELIMSLKGHRGYSVNSANYSKDGKYIVTAGGDHKAIIWNAINGSILQKLEGHLDDVEYADFSPDGKFVVTGSEDRTARIWKVTDGEVVYELLGHDGGVVSASYSPDGKLIVTSSNDNTCKIWNALTGELLLTFVAIDGDDHIVEDKFGRYDGTEAARKMLYFTCNTEIIELSQVKDLLWVPNLWERSMQGENINAPKINELGICGLAPLTKALKDQNGNYQFEIIPRRGGLGEVILQVNDIEIKRFLPSQLVKTSTGYLLSVQKKNLPFIHGKENRVSVKALTSNSLVSSRSAIIDDEADSIVSDPPNLYAIIVGVSDYKGEELDLQYAAKDAMDFANLVDVTAKKLFDTDKKEHVFIYRLHTSEGRDRFPEKNNIKELLLEIGKKTKPNDILLIFFAGHGAMSKQTKQFYFITADASKNSVIDALPTVGISMNELTEWIKPANMAAQKRVLIFDACHSGQAINDFVKLGKDDQQFAVARDDDKAEQIKAIEKLNEKSGMFILSASASNQSAYETSKYSQGVLTYSLLQAVKQQPTILDDQKFINVNLWFTAVEKKVRELAKESNSLQQAQMVSTTNFTIGVVDDEVRTKINLGFEKPVFSNCEFRNAETRTDNMKLRPLIDKQILIHASDIKNGVLIFQPGASGKDAYTLSSDYIISGDTIKASVLIIQGGAEIKARFEAEGKVDNLEGFAKDIVAQTTKWLSTAK